MLKPLTSPVFSQNSRAPRFAANQRPLLASPAQSRQATPQDTWQKLQMKQKQEAATKQVLQEWSRFREKKLSIYSAPGIQKAADQMTEALKRQVELAKRYTSGALQSYKAAGKLGKRQRLLLSARSQFDLS